MKKGIDVSENNGRVDWEAVKDAGIDFAIVRLGYGNRHLDERFYENINGAISAGLEVGVYYYSYALDAEAAEHEADFLVDILLDCGLTADRLPLGVWFDQEDADGYKERHGMPDNWTLTDICRAFIEVCRERGFKCGVYASLNWLENRLDTDAFPGAPIWCAQWDDECDWPGTAIWQYTDELEIDGRGFDGNICLAEVL
ncbi:MAG: hypothetical protein IJ741_05570 [Schwartzia sp.]|nr:hypothetical protein [Schwartzia sp. (in: firmicutes)]